MREQAYSSLAVKLRGSVISPVRDEYEVARKVYNGMIDRRPGAIVRCADVADVMTAVNFARNEDLVVAVRGGGHDGAGLGVCDRGLVIDLSSMKGALVNPATVAAEPRKNGVDLWGYQDDKPEIICLGRDVREEQLEKLAEHFLFGNEDQIVDSA